MSKHINVNPDHYKVAGRERQGDAVIQNLQRQQFAQQQAQTERWQAKHSGPPWETAAADSAEAEGQRPKAEGQGRAKAEGGRVKSEAKSLKGQKAESLTERRLRGTKAQPKKSRAQRLKGPKARKPRVVAVREKGSRVGLRLSRRQQKHALGLNDVALNDRQLVKSAGADFRLTPHTRLAHSGSTR